MKRLKQKKVAGLLVIALLALTAVGAYAYFTSTGSGTGTATVGSDSAWIVGQTATSGGTLYPDTAIGMGSIQTKTYTVNNPSVGNQNLATSRSRSRMPTARRGRPDLYRDRLLGRRLSGGSRTRTTTLAGNFSRWRDADRHRDRPDDRQRREPERLPGPHRPAVLLRELGSTSDTGGGAASAAPPPAHPSTDTTPEKSPA